jgi:adenylosuccinate lyase
MLHRFTSILRNLQVFPERMMDNLNASHGLVFSQQVMLALISTGLSREQAYDTVQPLAMKAWQEGASFRDLVQADPVVTARLDRAAIDQAFDPRRHLRHVDDILRRAGIEP